VVLSSFGVMFDDPAAAFANLRKALRRGGRLAFVCWRTREENPIFTIGFAEAAAVLDRLAAAVHDRAPHPQAPGRVVGAGHHHRVAAIVAVLGLSSAASAGLQDEIAALGTNLLVVHNGQALARQTATVPVTQDHGRDDGGLCGQDDDPAGHRRLGRRIMPVAYSPLTADTAIDRDDCLVEVDPGETDLGRVVGTSA
jgi:hypothetical protein